MNTRYVVLIALIVLSGIALAQHTRDAWQHLKNRVDFTQQLTYSLANAPITTEERNQIYALLDNKSIHQAFTDDEREEERKVVLSASVGLVSLGRDGRQQIVVRGMLPYLCSPTGNRQLWIFMRQSGKVRRTLDDEVNGLIVGRNCYAGFTDVLVSFHNSAFESSFTAYRWNGTIYKRIDCYLATSDPRQPAKSAVIRHLRHPSRR